MDRHQIYHSDPEIIGGTPVFTGTRVPVDSLIIHLKAGDSLDQFLDGFPSVSREQAEAFLEGSIWIAGRCLERLDRLLYS